MLDLTRRNARLTAAVAGAAFSLPKPVSFIEAAPAQKGPEAGKGFRPFKFGQIQGVILNDGVWEKPHDPSFIKDVSVEETKAALAAAGIANEVVPIPFNVTLVKLGNETVLFDAGTGGQFQPTAGAMIANMAAAGIKPEQITKVIVSHFHPDHVFGLMSKAPDNTPTFPDAVVYVPSNEYKFWMDESIFTKLPEKQHGLPKRLQAMFPLLKDKSKQYEWDTEVIPGIRSIAAPGHTPGHTAFHVASGSEQLMVLRWLPPLATAGVAGVKTSHDARAAARSRSTRSVTSRAMATEPSTSSASPLTIAKVISTYSLRPLL